MRLISNRLMRPLRGKSRQANAQGAPPKSDLEHVLRGAVDRQFYFVHHPDVAAARMEPAVHYDLFGWKEGRDPSPWFSTNAYLADHPDVAAANINPFAHFLTTGRAEHRGVRPSEAVLAHPLQGAALAMLRWELDQPFYLAQIERAGLSLQGLEPAIHYVLVGADRNLNPAPWFSTRFYREANPDIEQGEVNPFLHYLVYGRTESRAAGEGPASRSSAAPAAPEEFSAAGAEEPPASAPSASEIERQRAILAPRFSIPFYLGMNPDVAAAGVDPIVHFLQHGWTEGRDPSPYFSVSNYLEMNEDVRKVGINPFYHYIVSGENEGRLPKLDLGFRYDILKTHKERLSEKVAADRSHFEVKVEGEGALAAAIASLGKAKGLYLSVSHDNFTENFGGVQLILQREFNAIRAMNYHHLHLYPAAPLPVVDLSGEPSVVGVLLNGEYLGNVTVSALMKMLTKAPPASAPQRWFAVHSLLGHDSGALTAMMKALDFKKGWFWVHDYAALCSNYTLLRNDVQYCAAPAITSTSCQICRYGELRKLQVAEHARLFRHFEVTLAAPSATALAVFNNGGLHKAAGETVLEHCRVKILTPPKAAADATAKAAPKKSRRSRPLRVGFLGLPASHKGWPAFFDLALLFGEDERYEFHVFGKREPAGLPIKFHPVVVTGDNLTAMSHAIAEAEIDVVILWSIWPETFCFTAHEALVGGAALIGHKDGGHVVKLIEKQRCGLVLDNEAELAALFETGDIRRLARDQRPDKQYSLVYSNLTADLLKAAVR